MRNVIFMAGALLLGACSSGEPTATETSTTIVGGEVQEVVANFFGEKIEAASIVSTDELMEKLVTADSVACTFSGVINETCIKKGCWMTMDIGTEDEMRVRFKDYGFFVPTEGQSGKKAVIRGFARKETTSVADLRHYAEDGGMSAEEAEKTYTEPEVAFGFEADGVIIYD